MPGMAKHEKLRGGTEYNAVNKKSAQQGRDLVADGADDLGAAHRVDDDEESADSDETAIGEAEGSKNQVRKHSPPNNVQKTATPFKSVARMRGREGEGWSAGDGCITQLKRQWSSSG